MAEGVAAGFRPDPDDLFDLLAQPMSEKAAIVARIGRSLAED